MKRRMKDYVLLNRNGKEPEYVEVGFWIQGSGPGLDIEMIYKDSADPRLQSLIEQRRDESMWVVNRLVENDVSELPEDFLKYHRESRNPYDGCFGDIEEVPT